MYMGMEERKPLEKKSNHLLQKKSADTSVAQRYVRAQGYTIAAPPLPGAQRLLMVRDNEASTLYMRNLAPPIPELNGLGIQPDGTLVQDPLTGAQNQFNRFRQGTIPQIYRRVTVPQQRPIPWERRSFSQKMKFWQTPMETFNQTAIQQGGQQPQRNVLDMGKAQRRLRQQRRIVNQALRTARMLRMNIPNGAINAVRTNSAIQNINTQIQLLMQGTPEEKTVTGSLGLDIVKSLQVILNVANGQQANLGNNNPDEMEMLDAAITDLDFRLSQIQNEQDVIHLEPQMPTGCEISAYARKRYMYNQGGRSEKAEFDTAGFPAHIGWAFHYANLIHNAAVSTDSLSIEDAVGKSSGDGELANAHWFAHIYGAEEAQAPANQLGDLLGTAQGPNTQQPFHNIVPDCRFNRMSLAFRQNFIQNAGIVNGRFWTIHFRNAGDVITGSLRFTIRNNRIEYLLTAAPNQTFTPAMQHFLISTADSIAEDFAVQEFIRPQQQQIDNINLQTIRPLRLNHAAGPADRFIGGSYKLEELNP